ncbi:hypothetical protein Poli38472_012233 [Pythium oligandrum]|uniref:Uncharacterized protein n=1 Tax=Pythium oligandrum TaxID=41045 RepID=A0A8K1CP26_PYTOL|nr:hypothetical protein Poli38472_012233 [Pythium oligandrum]|eukprot:TMW67117.1 hypothetical protein Poli38472_012233 [Pythium oligandrum]
MKEWKREKLRQQRGVASENVNASVGQKRAFESPGDSDYDDYDDDDGNFVDTASVPSKRKANEKAPMKKKRWTEPTVKAKMRGTRHIDINVANRKSSAPSSRKKMCLPSGSQDGRPNGRPNGGSSLYQ